MFNLLPIIGQVRFILFGPEDVAKVGRAPWLVTSFVPTSTSTLTPSTHLASIDAVTTFEFLAGHKGAAANLPEQVVYGLKAFTCFPGDLEHSTHNGDLEIPNGFSNVPVGRYWKVSRGPRHIEKG